jgi:hypothetical protein
MIASGPKVVELARHRCRARKTRRAGADTRLYNWEGRYRDCLPQVSVLLVRIKASLSHRTLTKVDCDALGEPREPLGSRHRELLGRLDGAWEAFDVRDQTRLCY